MKRTFSVRQLVAALIGVVGAFFAYSISGHSMSGVWHPFLGLVIAAAVVAALVLIGRGFFHHQARHIRVTAGIAIVVAVLATLFHGAWTGWFIHLWTLRGFVAALVFALFLFLASLAIPNLSTVRGMRRNPRRRADSDSDDSAQPAYPL